MPPMLRKWMITLTSRGGNGLLLVLLGVDEVDEVVAARSAAVMRPVLTGGPTSDATRALVNRAAIGAATGLKMRAA